MGIVELGVVLLGNAVLSDAVFSDVALTSVPSALSAGVVSFGDVWLVLRSMSHLVDGCLVVRSRIECIGASCNVGRDGTCLPTNGAMPS